MDVCLGTGIDGVEAAQQIRRSHPCDVIFLIGSNETVTRLRVESTAPTGVVAKPILP